VDRRKFNQLAGLAGLGIFTWQSKLFSAQSGDEHAQARQKRGALNRYLVGAAYYPEWWPEPEWEVDFRQMHELGINAVRMGEFAWSRFEPSQGRFEFGWMDRAIEIARRYEIGVILGTATASVPPWLYQEHPDVLSANKQGAYTYGGRKSYNTNSPNYLEACSRIVTALAEHYGQNPGVIGWQLDNEPGYPFAEYDPDSKQAFQQWLKKRYGTLDELNRVWNGAFWSNEYNDWSQIDIPTNTAEGGWQPANSLDYRRFFSDSILNYLRRQADIVHAHSESQLVFTNWPAPTWSVDVYAAANEFLDATAWDNYVSAPGLSRFERQYIAGFLSDFSRCAGPHQRFLCAEQNAYVPPNADPEGLRLQAYCDLAHGALGQLYFEWRRPLAGGEEHRPSFIKGFDGKINPDKDKLAQICIEMARLGPKLANAATDADIALIYDYSNAWAQGMGDTNGDRIPHYGEIQSYYNGLKTLHRNIDIVPVAAKLDGYKVVVASNLRLVDDATIARLIEFVAGGGTLVLNDRVATQNMDNSMRRDLSPGPLTEIAGVRSVAALDLSEYSSQNGMFDAKLESELGLEFAGAETSYKPHTTVESLVLEGAETIATIQGGGLMAGKPVVTRHQYKKGWVFYAGADSTEGGFYETLARAVGTTAGITPLIDAPDSVEVTSRRSGDTTYYFLLNLGETPHEKIALPRPMDDVIGGRSGVSEVALGPLDVAVLAVRNA
jgi:beta-galactosidase